MSRKKIKRQEPKPVSRALVGGILVFCFALLATVGYGAYKQEMADQRVAQTTPAGDTAKQSDSGQDKPAADGNSTAKEEVYNDTNATEGGGEKESPEQTPSTAVNEGTTTTKEDNMDQTESSTANTETERVTISTAKGEIELELYPKLMPITVANFEKLISQKFYDGLTFHRVEDWVIQGGDPEGNGTGGPGWSIKLETSPALKNVRGALAMARSRDPNSAGSQFYILKTDATWLDGQYAVFGKVTKGMDIVDKIAIGDKMQQVQLEK
ncbi:MAG: peptidylprolyl isomerase [Bacillota bacterium]